MDEKITLLQGLCGDLTGPQARQLLEINQGDVNNAANQFWDVGLPTADSSNQVNQALQGYDDSLFSADRDGVKDGSAARPFLIEGGVVSGAPTRPPSRNSNHSMDSAVNMSNVAIKSVEESGQESGIIGSSGAVFGPANRDTYDADKWAVALVGTQEKVPDVAALERKREEDGPAFLKPLPNGDYLPSLVTMLSTIPSIRNILLCPKHVAADYGREEGWWKGTPIPPPALVEIDGEMSPTVYLEMVHEVQRIIAFLSFTDRAYGSLEALCKQEAFNSGVSDDSLIKFLLGWERAVEASGLGNGLRNPLHCEVKAEGEVQNSHYLDATVIRGVPGERVSLYDVLDGHMFPDKGGAFVTTLCDVLIIKLGQSDTTARKLDVEIPSTFYADRYLESNAPAVSQVLQDARQYEEKIAEINSKINKVKYHHSKKTGQSVESLKLLRVSMKAFEAAEGEEVQDEKSQLILQDLQRIYNNIEVKIKELDEQKVKVREILDDITGIFKPPKEAADQAASGETADGIETATPMKPLQNVPTVPYKLCGVATEPNTVYLRRGIADPDDKRWWRIQYQYTYDSPLILREQVTEDVVLKRASEEHNEALLIYASQNAIYTPLASLPKPLEHFVRQDNLQFMEELQKASDKPAWDNSVPPESHRNIVWDGPLLSTESNHDFADMNASHWLDQQQSSNALTPSSEMTETGGEVREIEMKEVEHIEVLPKGD